MVFKTEGVCCKEIALDVEDGVIKQLTFSNGCNGNLKGIAELAKGRKPQEIIDAVAGIKCGSRETSCPDQLALALKSFL